MPAWPAPEWGIGTRPHDALLVLTITSADAPPFVCAAHDKAQAREEVRRLASDRRSRSVLIDEWQRYGSEWRHVGAYSL